MNYNYHTHTKYCHHAKDEIEEYIKRAIDGGILYMGFSDHIPLKFDDGFESSYRISTAEVGEYYSKVNELREKYKERIDIKIGFEMEYYPKSFDKMLKAAVDFGGEYLILGQHFYEEEILGGTPTIRETDDLEKLKEYVRLIVCGIKSGAFTYIAHPDIIGFTGEGQVYANEMRKICIASREYKIPLEINFLGIREKRNYPNAAFWKLAGEEGSPVTFGCDAHTAQSVCDEKSLAYAEEIVKKYHLNYIGKPNIIKINEK